MSASPTSFSFSQRTLTKLPPCPATSASTSSEYSDTDVVGLKLQVSKTGRKVFYFRYTINRQKRIARIGEFPAMDVADARKAALAMRAQVDQGQDPQDERDTLKGMPTFREFGDQQYMPHARQTKLSAKGDESKLRLHVYPRFGRTKVSEVTTRDVQLLLNEMAASHCKATANRVHAMVARMFKLATVWGVIDKSPCFGLSKFKEERKAERFLTPDEIGRFVTALAADKNTVAADALRLLLLSGLRRSEVLRARWEQVDLEGGLMFLPKTKAGKPRYAVLNSRAKELVAGLPSRAQGEWLFPNPRSGKPVENPKRLLLRTLKIAGIDPMRIHDLRHTFASTAINAGATLYEVQALLGHSSPTMTMRYAHLAQDTVRRASEAVADVVGGVRAPVVAVSAGQIAAGDRAA